MRIKTLSVSEVNGYIKKIFAGDLILNNLSVRGEISNLRLVTQRNAYFFSLKDSYSSIQCVMYLNAMESLNFIPADGMEITAHGKVALYEKNGSYSLNIDSMEPYGVGAYYIAFNTLKRKLETEGLFDRAHKRSIPQYPEKIGVITSINGAAVHDIIKVLSGRYPYVEVDILPITVQGDKAADEICRAFNAMNNMDDIDLIILARGGGSVEDLWPFNEEKVARAIYASRCPVISAVGHETDFTISDFVADARAATPTEAAAMAVPDRNALMENIEQYKTYLVRYMEDTIIRGERHLEFIVKSSPLSRPEMFFEKYDGKLNQLKQLLAYHMAQYINRKQMETQLLEKQLQTLNPLDVLKRGFAIIYSKDKGLISDAGKVQVNDEIMVRLHNGLINCRVEEVSGIE
ncbi:MAG: exodeoxyribonuclease VII large subunit [Thermoanaerobacteraceae bacterium]|nr:exodeoxyribonuclease VII large subunit [Thermoanaerobacteraceae bacterium]